MWVVMFAFWGRRANIESQLPFIRRILDEHPQVEFNAWNLARTEADHAFIESLPVGPRFRVYNDAATFDEVYRFYTQPAFRGALLVKIDDDVVFGQTGRFGDYLEVVAARPGAIVSANVINNAACSRIQSGLRESFDRTGIALLDWHLHNKVAVISHEHMLASWGDVLAEPVAVVPT